MATLRIGVLGAAEIAPAALVEPARETAGVEVAAIAARSRPRAEAFAAKYGIRTVHDSYAALLDDPEVDAVYIPLPNGLHAEWTLKAIERGKHVLCEKPMASNRAVAEKVAAASETARLRSGLVVMEAFHYRYHPLAERVRTLIHGDEPNFGAPGAAGQLGAVQRVEVSVCIPLPRFSDIRYQYALAGGATMDAGCYAVHAARLFGGEDPKVVSAAARTLRTDLRIDRAMTAELAYPGGATGRIRVSLWSRTLLSVGVRVTGERGELKVTNFILPQLYNRLTVRTDGKRRSERVQGETSYTLQLRAFMAAIAEGRPPVTSAQDAVITMGLLDDIYRAAGLPLRE